MVRIALWLTVLAGCDIVYGLDRTAPASAVIEDPDGDFDGDGAPNATDPCPLFDNELVGAETDDDGDGIGALCDPHPDATDCLTLFDDFATLSPHWQFDGAPITFEAEKQFLHFDAGPEAILWLDVPVHVTSLVIAGYLPGSGQGHRAVQMFVAHELAAAITGRACGLDQAAPTAPTQVAHVEVTDGADRIVDAVLAGGAPLNAGTTFGLAWSADAEHPEACSSSLTANGVEMRAFVAEPMVDSGHVAIRTLNAGLDLQVIIGYGRLCE